MTNRNVIVCGIKKYHSTDFYARVIVYEPANGRNQSDFNLHISQMQKQVGRAARNFFPGATEIEQREVGQKKEDRGKEETDKIPL